MKLAAIAMPDTEPLRYAVDDLPGYGFEILADDVDVPIVGTLAKFERGELEGIGFIQTQTGNEVAAIAWPEGEPKRFLVIDLEGVGVKITDRMDPPSMAPTQPPTDVQNVPINVSPEIKLHENGLVTADGVVIQQLAGTDNMLGQQVETAPVVSTAPAEVIGSAAPASEVAASPAAPEAAADVTSAPTTPAA